MSPGWVRTAHTKAVYQPAHACNDTSSQNVHLSALLVLLRNSSAYSRTIQRLNSKDMQTLSPMAVCDSNHRHGQDLFASAWVMTPSSTSSLSRACAYHLCHGKGLLPSRSWGHWHQQLNSWIKVIPSAIDRDDLLNIHNGLAHGACWVPRKGLANRHLGSPSIQTGPGRRKGEVAS